MIVGLIAGALARLLVPGKQQMSIAMTIVLGIIGSVIGAVIALLVWTRVGARHTAHS